MSIRLERYDRSTMLVAALLLLLTFGLFNANGREIGTYDSQATKFTARELARSGTLTLDRVLAAQPLYGQRPAFGLARDGHWRSRYPVAPAILGGIVGWVLGAVGILDLDAALAPTIIAKVAAACLTSLTVVLLFLAGARSERWQTAAVVSLAFAFGTGAWNSLSQTLWQSETATFGLAVALYALWPLPPVSWTRGLATFCGLGLVMASRWQLAPAVVILAVWTLRHSPRSSWWTSAPLFAACILVATTNVSWFGHVLGGAIEMERQALVNHALTDSANFRAWEGLGGLLFSPNRGLLVFSPIVLVALVGTIKGSSLARTAALAATVQLLVYSTYSTWWGGHTYGPRYALEVLPLLALSASAGVPVIVRRPVLVAASLVALGWSVAVAATGAFCFPAERWNTEPVDVDRQHERLWDWNDTQVSRCWATGLSPQNFALFDGDAWRGGR